MDSPKRVRHRQCEFSEGERPTAEDLLRIELPAEPPEPELRVCIALLGDSRKQPRCLEAAPATQVPLRLLQRERWRPRFAPMPRPNNDEQDQQADGKEEVEQAAEPVGRRALVVAADAVVVEQVDVGVGEAALLAGRLEDRLPLLLLASAAARADSSLPTPAEDAATSACALPPTLSAST